MEDERINIFVIKHKQALDNHLCPECGMIMQEAQRSDESGFVFVWWECPRDNCWGQWLEKKASVMSVA
ncbi:MAG: hypothetical protein PHF37_00725 [Phycisphaerae bacterium]|nr:hypothetical protein [Phycisphaerae bacterium]